MTPVVVEVGPAAVRGPEAVPAEWAEQAIACRGDRLAVVDGRIVEVADLWRDVLAAACGARPQRVALVLPTWWPTSAASTVTAAARELTSDVMVLRRAELLAAAHDGAVVELAGDLVVVHRPGTPLRILDREKVSLPDILGGLGAALLDVPAGVTAPSGRPCERSGRQHVVRAVAAETAPVTRRGRTGLRRVAVLAGCALALAGTVPWWTRNPAPAQWVLLTEGRVAMDVPAGWAVRRVTAGPGSARVQVSAPGGTPALHLTQSVTSGPASLRDVAESLRSAIELAPDGVFVDFRADATVGDRPAVTYRELRAAGQTDWAVVVDGDVRIAVGCQVDRRPTGGLGEECVRAVRSARAVR
ncbi:type VII secretion-associated protein (TIGR03931 family) [Mycobacterium sp. BK558]|nr:type VII secretion-associated protein (TIGR03931 family) [Mycobacterium sp. BK558]